MPLGPPLRVRAARTPKHFSPASRPPHTRRRPRLAPTIRDRLVFKARQLEEQGEFRAAELLNRRADALSEQLTEKIAYSAELIGQSEAAEDVRAGRQPTSFYRSQLERQYSVRRRPAPADPGQLAATASLFSTANTGGSHTAPGPAC